MGARLQTRGYLCVICCKREIKQYRVEHPIDASEVPDQCNCDFSKYDGYHITGGRLFTERSELPWRSVRDSDPIAVFGGICTDCLKNEAAERLLSHLDLEPIP